MEFHYDRQQAERAAIYLASRNNYTDYDLDEFIDEIPRDRLTKRLDIIVKTINAVRHSCLSDRTRSMYLEIICKHVTLRVNIYVGRSLINSKKSNGPSTEP